MYVLSIIPSTMSCFQETEARNNDIIVQKIMMIKVIALISYLTDSELNMSKISLPLDALSPQQ